MRYFFLALVLGALVSSAGAQLDMESTPPDKDQNDLFARAAASRIAIVGTVVKSEGVLKNLAPDALVEHLNKGTAAGGSLVTVRVEETVCRQSDFDNNTSKADDGSLLYYLFIPFDESELPGGRYREVLLPNHRYFLLLDALDTPSLALKYKLDPNRNYYRGKEQNRGIIPLDPGSASNRARNPPEVVDKFRKLCAAMRPANPEDKLALLQRLADSGDPVLAKEAENAQKAVRLTMMPLSPPDSKPH